jgi:hypothetical protein
MNDWFSTLVVFRLHYLYLKELCNVCLNVTIYDTLESIPFATVLTYDEKFKCQLKKVGDV